MKPSAAKNKAEDSMKKTEKKPRITKKDVLELLHRVKVRQEALTGTLAKMEYSFALTGMDNAVMEVGRIKFDTTETALNMGYLIEELKRGMR